jgi:NADH-quinone oxidoreductase subunit E/NADP-reducing hydrogenase subunit HndA
LTLGYLPVEVQEKIARRLQLPLVQVHGVVSFYRFFTTRPRAKYQLQVCMGTACFVRRARALTESIQQVLGLDPGCVSNDGLFGLEEVRCLGSCGLAPVVKLNSDTHGHLTPADARKLIFGLQSRARRERTLGLHGEDDG